MGILIGFSNIVAVINDHLKHCFDVSQTLAMDFEDMAQDGKL
jgi:hypothetical protein